METVEKGTDEPFQRAACGDLNSKTPDWNGMGSAQTGSEPGWGFPYRWGL